MTDILIDNPIILSMLFHPRRAEPTASRVAQTTFDGTLAAGDGTPLGYRLYKAATPNVIVFFHGNGEVATDYDDLAPFFHAAGASVVVMDYRGYGWSGGKPLGSTLLPDAEAAWRALPKELAQHGIGDARWFIMGRSLGSAPAVHLAYTFPEQFKALILDSAFAHTPSLLTMLGIPKALLTNIRDPFDNEGKIASVKLPLLVIHGENDTLIPVTHGQRLHDASPTTQKVIMRVPRAGHNNILALSLQAYFTAIKTLIDEV